MAGDPYIKSEPSDLGFDPSQFMQFNNPHGTGNMNINPANLANGGANAASFGHMSSSFNVGNSGIADDEL
ncbi:hypothetical protein LTR53_005632, partial [Teratosphaeriaceae sp. CCFEE 6253]